MSDKEALTPDYLATLPKLKEGSYAIISGKSMIFKNGKWELNTPKTPKEKQ